MWKKIAIGLLVVLLLVVGVFVYLWRQVTALPDWYTQAVAVGDVSAGPAVAEGGVVGGADGVVIPEAATPQWQDDATATSPRKELRNFHRKAARKDPAVAKVIKASRATFADGTLEVGVVADLRNLQSDRLDRNQRELFAKIAASFPSAVDREVYIGIEDPAPVFTAAGAYEPGPTAQLRSGNMRLDLDSAAKRMGVSPAQLRTQFAAQAKSLGVGAPG